VALHGAEVVAVTALGLSAGRTTHGHRFEAEHDPIEIPDADAYAETLRRHGAVIASYAERRALIAAQLKAVAARAGVGLAPIQDDALLDEVTALVERPNALLCQFEHKFLGVPQECLILTMKANQKYFPLLDAAGKLTSQFIVVSNVTPADPSAIVTGNERVVRPRLADAQFFYDQDRKQTLASRVPGLAKVVYHNELGTQAERSKRVRAIARGIAGCLGRPELAAQADQAAMLAKADLLTGMVGEFPELQGIMGRYYAQHDGLPAAVADAIEDHYKPRFSGDTLPRGDVGTVVALADKLETLVGLFGTGHLPSGEKDPFALRRHALGVIRMLIEKQLPIPLSALLGAAWPTEGLIQVAGAAEGRRQLDPQTPGLVKTFLYERLSGYLRDLGHSAQEVDAVLALQPERLDHIRAQLDAVRAFAQLPEAPALAAANKRIGNILKKSESAGATPAVDAALLHESAEQALHAAMQQVVPQANARFAAGDYTASLQTLAALRAPVDAFFDGVMVNAEDPALRANRLALLDALHRAMNRVADLARLAG
jgi:glycyl-tRNA synthetase beta chain